MPKFMIPIKWRNWGVINIEAESLDKAVEEVNLNLDEMNVPDGEAVEGSHKIDFEELELLNPGHTRRELEAKDFGIVDKEPLKVKEVCDDEEREARRHLAQLGEGYQEDSEGEGDEEEG